MSPATHKTSPLNTWHIPRNADRLAIPVILVVSAAVHLSWIYYTRYTAEDAHITFRFAEQLAAGHGFVYNPGERVYGTTTPLFTILLSLWLKFVSGNIILGADLFNLCAAVSIPILTWKTLKYLERSRAEQFFVIFTLLFSAKLIFSNTEGMETPLCLSLMAASWYSWAKGWTKLTGLLCGLLLWTRIDTVIWPVILCMATLLSSRKNSIILGTTIAILYLPWLVFATIYFGSPIPQTVTAKWVAYSQFNRTSYISHIAIILNYLSPFRDQAGWRWLGAAIIVGIAGWGIWRTNIYRNRLFYTLAAFAVVETLRLTLLRATFFNRYFVPILWPVLILFGLGLGALWDRLKTAPVSRNVFLLFFIALTAAQTAVGLESAQSVKDSQFFRNESSLKAMGLWLKNNTPPQSTVLLEPLGYVGYYSGRIMIDEVGLVTPAVTALKLKQVNGKDYPSIFQTDYVIAHCDEELGPQFVSDQTYLLIQTFNPLDYKVGSIYSSGLPRNSCYQIWVKNYR